MFLLKLLQAQIISNKFLKVTSEPASRGREIQTASFEREKLWRFKMLLKSLCTFRQEGTSTDIKGPWDPQGVGAWKRMQITCLTTYTER